MPSITEFGDGVTRTFNTPPEAGAISATINGAPTSAFSEGANSITFSTAPAYKDKIVISYVAATARSTGSAASSATPFLAGLVLAVLSSSYGVAGAVTGDGQNGKTWSTNRSIHQWVNARMGRPFRKIEEFGKNGDGLLASANGAGMLNRFDSQVLALKTKPHYVALCGHIINTSNLGTTFDQYVQGIESLCQKTEAAGIGLIVEIDPYVDAMLSDANRMAFYYRAVDYLETLHSRWAHVITVPVHRYVNPRGASESTNGRSFTADFTHPTTGCILHGYLPAYQDAFQNRFARMPLPWKGIRDPYEMTFNGRLDGAATPGAGAPDFFWQNGSGFAPGNVGPRAFGVTTSGSGIVNGTLIGGVATYSVVSSKAANPLDRADGYGETALPCWKLVLTTGPAGGGTFTIFTRDQAANYVWTSGGSVTDPFRFVRPTVDNGCWYRPIVAGNLSTGSDPTSTWPTTIGSVFQSGSATLLTCPKYAGNQAQGLSEIIVDQSAYAAGTLWSIESACQFVNSGNTNAVLADSGSSGMFNGVSNAIRPYEAGPPEFRHASFGNIGGIDNLGPETYARLSIATQYDSDILIPEYADYHKRFDTIQLGASSSVTLYYVAMGTYPVR